MKSILVISNNSFVESLVNTFQQLLKAQIVYVSDFDQGLKEVFDKRPALVFIQSEISGITGDAVAKHIKGLLRDDSPRLILLREAPDKPLGSRNTFEENIDLFLSPEDVTSQFKAQMEKIPALQWRESVESSVSQSPLSVEQLSPSVQAKARVEAPQPPLSPVPVGAPASPPLPARSASPSPLPVAPKPVTVSAGQPPPVAPQPQVRVAGPSLTINTQTSPKVSPASATDKGSFSSFSRGAGNPSVRRPWLYLVGFLVTAAVIGTCYVASQFWPTGKVKQTVKNTAQPVKPVSPALKMALPSSIPLNNRDFSYDKLNPGWERYLGSDFEYLVFRDQGMIKALQVIARTESGVTDVMVKSLLKEATGSSDYAVTSSRQKDGYLVEEGGVVGNGEILIYRKQPSGVIRALVIAVS